MSVLQFWIDAVTWLWRQDLPVAMVAVFTTILLVVPTAIGQRHEEDLKRRP